VNIVETLLMDVNFKPLPLKLIRDGQKTEELFVSLDDLEWDANVYQDGVVWKVRDILAHFISSEKSFILLFDNILYLNQGTPENFSIDEFNNSQIEKMKDISTADLLTLFMITRKQTVIWVENLTEEDLEKIGQHPAMGVAKLRDMIKMIYLHNQMHLRDLRSVLKPINGN
jgi:hypothetical protein